MKNLAAKLAAAIANTVGSRELTMLAGLVLSGYGAWLVYAPAGFVLPGAVMLYVAIVGLR